MKVNYPFEAVLVRNRLGQGMKLMVCPFSLSKEHVCVLVALPKNLHPRLLAKNAEHIVFQLRERFNRAVKKFSMLEQRVTEEMDQWYAWDFNWVGNTPLEPKSRLLSDQQRAYYEKVITGDVLEV